MSERGRRSQACALACFLISAVLTQEARREGSLLSSDIRCTHSFVLRARNANAPRIRKDDDVVFSLPRFFSSSMVWKSLRLRFVQLNSAHGGGAMQKGRDEWSLALIIDEHKENDVLAPFACIPRV